MLLLEATEPVASTFPLEIWVPALVSLLVSFLALGGVVWSNWIAGRREERRVQAERVHEHARWARDQKIVAYSTIAAAMLSECSAFAEANRWRNDPAKFYEQSKIMTAERAVTDEVTGIVQILGGRAVDEAIRQYHLRIAESLMKSFRYEDDSDELIKVDHATLQRLSDLNYWAYSDALEAMQRDLEIVPLPEERQGERQGGDDQ